MKITLQNGITISELDMGEFASLFPMISGGAVRAPPVLEIEKRENSSIPPKSGKKGKRRPQGVYAEVTKEILQNPGILNKMGRGKNRPTFEEDLTILRDAVANDSMLKGHFVSAKTLGWDVAKVKNRFKTIVSFYETSTGIKPAKYQKRKSSKGSKYNTWSPEEIELVKEGLALELSVPEIKALLADKGFKRKSTSIHGKLSSLKEKAMEVMYDKAKKGRIVEVENDGADQFKREITEEVKRIEQSD